MSQLVVQHKTQTTEYRHIIGLQHTCQALHFAVNTQLIMLVYELHYFGSVGIWS